MRSGEEGIEDGVEEELAEVVNRVRDEGCDAEVVRAGLGVGGCEGGEVDAGEVEEGVAVVSGEVVLCLSNGSQQGGRIRHGAFIEKCT